MTTGTNVVPITEPPGIVIDWPAVAATVVTLGSPKRPAGVTEKVDGIVLLAAYLDAHLTESTTVFPTSIADRCGRTPAAVRDSLKRLADAGMLDRDAVVSDSGNALLVYVIR